VFERITKLEAAEGEENEISFSVTPFRIMSLLSSLHFIVDSGQLFVGGRVERMLPLRTIKPSSSVRCPTASAPLVLQKN